MNISRHKYKKAAQMQISSIKWIYLLSLYFQKLKRANNTVINILSSSVNLSWRSNIQKLIFYVLHVFLNTFCSNSWKFFFSWTENTSILFKWLTLLLLFFSKFNKNVYLLWKKIWRFLTFITDFLLSWQFYVSIFSFLKFINILLLNIYIHV